MKLKRIIAVTSFACIALVLVGCSSDSKSSSSTTTTPKQAVCADKSALQSSVKDLTNPSTLTGGKSSFTSALDQVQSDLDALAKSAKADVQPQVDDLKNAVNDLKSTVKDFGNGSLSDNLQKTGEAITKVGSTAGALYDSLSSQCPSS